MATNQTRGVAVQRFVMLRELRYAIAGLRRRPAFAVTAILSIGIGVGAATTVLSVLIALLVRPLPYAAPDRLVAIWPGKGLASREVEAIQQQATKLARVSSLSPGWLMSLTHVAVPQQVDAGRTLGDLFGLIGVRALLGRPFGAEAEVPGRDKVAVLSYDLWQSQFAGDRSIIGRSIVLNGAPYTVLAVMPKEFRAFTFTSDVWVPLPADHSEMWWTQATTLAFGRLRAGVSAREASGELATITPRIQREFQLATDWTTGARIVGLQESMVGALKPMVLLLAGAVGLLLALGAANVTTLLLVRAAERHDENGRPRCARSHHPPDRSARAHREHGDRHRRRPRGHGPRNGRREAARQHSTRGASPPRGNHH